jgi:hypothetical protein
MLCYQLMSNAKELASAALLFLETANDCLTEIQYDHLQDAICQHLGDEVVEAMLLQKLNKGGNEIVVKKIHNHCHGLNFIRLVRTLSGQTLTLHAAKQLWDEAVKDGRHIKIFISPNLDKAIKTQTLLKLSHICFFVIE